MLKNITIEIKEGDCLALAGESGSDFLNGNDGIDEALDFGEAGHVNIEIDP